MTGARTFKPAGPDNPYGAALEGFENWAAPDRAPVFVEAWRWHQDGAGGWCVECALPDVGLARGVAMAGANVWRRAHRVTTFAGLELGRFTGER